jgi:hypothetical protein
MRRSGAKNPKERDWARVAHTQPAKSRVYAFFFVALVLVLFLAGPHPHPHLAINCLHDAAALVPGVEIIAHRRRA